MESSWGRNVAALGLAHTNATLAARFLANPDVILTNGSTTGKDRFAVWFTSSDMSFPWLETSTAKTPLLGNFPYGQAVEPVELL